MSKPRRVTSADVAREVGLSRTTVGYVLNQTPHQKIPEATRQRVLAAAEKLNYSPSAAARELRGGRSTVVLCLLPDWPLGLEVGALMENLSNALGRLGLTLVAHPRARSTRPIAEIWKALTPAAVLTFEDLDPTETAAMQAVGIGTDVLLLSPSSLYRPSAMGNSEERKGRMQAEHLAATGRRRIGYAFPDDERLLSFARPRLLGVRQACAELGLDEPEVRTVPMDVEGTAEVVRGWVGGSDPVTGVAAYNDDVAMAVLAGAAVAGFVVPTDLAVVGVDDIPIGRVSRPTLTTIRSDLEQFAEVISLTVVNRMNGEPDPPQLSSVAMSVVVRASA